MEALWWKQQLTTSGFLDEKPNLTLWHRWCNGMGFCVRVCLPGERRLPLLREGQITAGGGTLRSIMSFVFFIGLSRRLVYWSQLQCHNNKKKFQEWPINVDL